MITEDLGSLKLYTLKSQAMDLSLELVEDPNASSELLHSMAMAAIAEIQNRLCESWEPQDVEYGISGEICTAIAQYPNASPSILLELFSLFPLPVLKVIWRHKGDGELKNGFFGEISARSRTCNGFNNLC
jgi:hypothetical protein